MRLGIRIIFHAGENSSLFFLANFHRSKSQGHFLRHNELYSSVDRI